MHNDNNNSNFAKHTFQVSGHFPYSLAKDGACVSKQRRYYNSRLVTLKALPSSAAEIFHEQILFNSLLFDLMVSFKPYL